MPPSEHMWDSSGKHENNYLFYKIDPVHSCASIRVYQLCPHQERSFYRNDDTFFKSATVQQGVTQTAHMRSILIPGVFFSVWLFSYLLGKVQDASWQNFMTKVEKFAVGKF